MKTIIRRHISFKLMLALFIAPIFGYSQNYAQDMEKILNKYNHGDISFQMKYRFYPYDSISKASDSMNASCTLTKGGYYYKVVSGTKTYEYVRNSSYYFVIDHVQKVIAIKKATEAKGQLWDMSKIDSMMHSNYAKVVYKEAGKDEGEYDVKLTEGTWDRFQVVFNKSTYAIVKVNMHATSRGKMVGQSYRNPMIGISYSSYMDKVADKSIFSESRFFTVNGDNVVPTQEYNKYKVLNNLKKPSPQTNVK